MATDKFPELKELTLKAPNLGIISFVAVGAIPMWAPVKLVGAGTGIIPDVSVTTTDNDPLVIGIAVGGAGTPVNPDGTTGTAADGTGDIVDVAVLNSGVITKVKTVGTLIVLGSVLKSSTTSGAAALIPLTATINPVNVIGKALQAAGVTGDTILIFMGGSF